MAEPRLILLDRDGTLIVEKDYLSHPDEVELIPGVGEAIRSLRAEGHKVVLISNQSGVARGYFDEEAVRQVHQRLLDLLEQEGTTLDGIFYCPHGPEDGCRCRKPRTGMLEDASRTSGLPLVSAIVVGDKLADLEAGKSVGAMTVLVRTGYGKKTEQTDSDKADHILDSMASLAELI